MTFKPAKILVIIPALVICYHSLYGTTRPDRQMLLDASGPKEFVDENLEEWLKKYANKSPLHELEPLAFDKALDEHDLLTQIYVRLVRNRKDPATMKVKTADIVVDEAEDLILNANANKNSQLLDHPLASFVFLELLRHPDSKEQNKLTYEKLLSESGKNICAQKQWLYELTDHERMQNHDAKKLTSIIESVGRFNSTRFKELTWQRIATNTPTNMRESVRVELNKALDDDSSVYENTSWLKKSNDNKTAAVTFGDQVIEQTKQKRCTTAKKQLIKDINTFEDTTLKKAYSVAEKVGKCYKRRGQKARMLFWNSITETFESKFGFAGKAETELQKAYLYWVRDDFKKSKKTYNDLVVEARLQKNNDVLERALYGLGRVSENEMNLLEAKDYYSQYIDEFIDGPNINNVLTAIALIHIDQNEWHLAGEKMEILLNKMDQLQGDSKDGSETAFALFWLGRIQLMVGKHDLAKEYWRRLASEYYSTYYGALGHFLLENLIGKKLALAPTRSEQFHLANYTETFSVDDQKRIDRINQLLKIGYAKSAECEIDELADSEDPKNHLVKALLLHASGDWLESIKTFSNLPRSFRTALPNGFERLLFPVKFRDQIQSYAGKAEVDPNFVKAIIRQESVFNPRAKSPAGAMGLMQLMPFTAKVESRRLQKSYVTSQKKTSLKQMAKRKKNLLEPEVNIALGVHHVHTLLDKFKSPVFALSAYNASPTAARKWIERYPMLDSLTFIERIPYKETQSYVKLVLRNYFYYQRWYGEGDAEMKHLEYVAQPIMAHKADEAE